jgi:hypothetical protein
MSGFVEREIDRLRAAILDHGNADKRDALYAAQQALEWAREPTGFAAPFAVAMGIREAREDCPASHRPPLS